MTPVRTGRKVCVPMPKNNRFRRKHYGKKGEISQADSSLHPCHQGTNRAKHLLKGAGSTRTSAKGTLKQWRTVGMHLARSGKRR